MAEESKLGVFKRWASEKVGDRVAEAAKRNLNAMLDAVEGFEERGGLSTLLDDMAPGTGVGLIGVTYDGKSLRQYYANLETEYGADLNTVKKSYRRLMRLYHPDRHSGDPEREKLATELSQELTRAYDVICDHLRAREGRGK